MSNKILDKYHPAPLELGLNPSGPMLNHLPGAKPVRDDVPPGRASRASPISILSPPLRPPGKARRINRGERLYRDRTTTSPPGAMRARGQYGANVVGLWAHSIGKSVRNLIPAHSSIRTSTLIDRNRCTGPESNSRLSGIGGISRIVMLLPPPRQLPLRLPEMVQLSSRVRMRMRMPMPMRMRMRMPPSKERFKEHNVEHLGSESS